MKLQNFLYLLLRDYLPSGQVEAIMLNVRSCAGKTVSFSNPLLAQYAAELAAELWGDK